MTKLTQAQQRAMSNLAKFYNPKYHDESLCHSSDVAITSVTLSRLEDAGFIKISKGLVAAKRGFIRFTDSGLKAVGLKTEALL